jgi:beta-xylosidase
VAHAAQPAAQCADPSILIDHGVTLMCTGLGGFPTRSASSLDGLSSALPHSAFAATGWPGWARDGFWAPDLEHVGDRYLMYYSARRRSDGRHCIGVAVSDRPDGGFQDVGAPLITDEPDGAIDPALLSVSGQLFLFYKRDGNSVRAPSVIFGRRLSADGLHLAGPRVQVLKSRAGGWEHGIIEAPAPVNLGGTTYLIYSEGLFVGFRYAEGEAVRTGDPLGPYRRVSAVPLLHGDGHWVGTGGGSVVVDGGQLLLVYNAFAPGRRPVRRLLFIRPLSLQDGILRQAGPARQIPLRGD